MPPFTKETAVEMAARSALVRQRRKDMSPAERVRDISARDADAAIRDLIKAAHGTPPYEDLSPEKRIDALKTILAYGVGRPTTSKVGPADVDPEDDEPEEEAPLV